MVKFCGDFGDCWSGVGVGWARVLCPRVICVFGWLFSCLLVKCFGDFGVCWSGVARQPVTFFASPKKVTQKRRPRCHWPSASQFCRTKNGKASKLASLRQRSFLYPFSALHNWQCQKWMKVKKTKAKATATSKQTKSSVLHFSINSCRSLFLTWFLTYPRSRRCNLCFTENG
jgi:hypothetical protein